LIAYFDSSAIVKLVLAEHGSMLVRELWDGFEPYTSVVSIAESRSAVARAERGGRVDALSSRRAVRNLKAHFESATLVDVDRTLAEQAASLAETHGLRGFDAIHLATAKATVGRERMKLVVAWDDDLAGAAFAEGINVARELAPV
jgi:predicted nucleic acid-binding protein